MEEIQTQVHEPTEGRTGRLLRGPHSQWMLSVISFTESSFLPILIDPFLVIMILAHPRKWVRYTYIAASASVIGGIFGYILGALFFDLIGARLIDLYGLQDEFARTVALFDTNAFWVVLIGAFTPIPYKIFALVGGFLKINFFMFVFASILGRVARFALVGFITQRFGRNTLALFSRNIHIATAVVILFTVAYATFTLTR